MWRFFHWLVLRYLAQHRLLSLLNALSVAAGVAVYLAIQLANTSANRAFADTIDVVAGKAQLEVSATGNDLPDTTFPLVQHTAGVAAATPLVRALVSLPDYPGDYLDVLGVDILTNEPFRTFSLTTFGDKDVNQGNEGSGAELDPTKWLGGGDALAVTQAFADRHHLGAGDTLRIQIDGAERNARIGFVLTRGSGLDEHFAALDIGWAQELLHRRGRLSSIEVRLAPGADRNLVAQRLRATLPIDVQVAAPAQRSAQIDQMLGSFQLNLTAMSLVSLLVGAFLIWNTTSASVVRRQREIGILRSLGISQRQAGAVFLSEAVVSAVIGTVLGLIFGTLLARGLVGSVSETVSSLYVLINVRQISASWSNYASAAGLGMLTAVAAAWLPARAAARQPPVLALHPELTDEGSERLSRRFLLGGIGALVLVAIISAVALRFGPPWTSFLAALFCLGGASCFAPHLVSILAAMARRLSGRRFLQTHLAAMHLRRSLYRNAVTVAALASAVAMAVAVTVMIFSFRQTVGAWIEQTLVADLFVTPASNEIGGPTSFLPPAALAYFEHLSGVTAVDTFRQIEIPFRGAPVALAAIRADGSRIFPFTHGDSGRQMQRFRQERCVIVSEPFARRYRLGSGDVLNIPTPEGQISLPIAGVFYDYARDQGIVFMSSQTFVRLFRDDRVNSLGIYLRPGVETESIAAAFRQQFSARGEYAIYSNRALRQRAFEVFDQTFAVTYVLRAIAVIVAVAGIFLSFTTLIIERSRLFGIMRAVGTSKGEIRGILIRESILVGVAASALGLLSGTLLSFILTGVVNRAFFGWTIRLHWPWMVLASTPLWIIAAAIVAVLLPARRAAQLPLAETLRSE